MEGVSTAGDMHYNQEQSRREGSHSNPNEPCTGQKHTETRGRTTVCLPTHDGHFKQEILGAGLCDAGPQELHGQTPNVVAPLGEAVGQLNCVTTTLRLRRRRNARAIGCQPSSHTAVPAVTGSCIPKVAE